MDEKYRMPMIAALLVFSVFLTYYFHAILALGTVFSHIFYIPIILSALWWGRRSVLVALFLAGLLVGSSIIFRLGDPTIINDYLRALMFVVVSLVIASLSEQVQGRQHELHREKNRFQTLLDVAGVLLVVINADQTVGLINRRGLELLGYREAEIMGKNWFDVIAPDQYRQEAKGAFDRIMAGDMTAFEQAETPVVSKTGREYTIAWQDTVLRDESGTIIGILASGKDITDRIRAEEALRVANEEANLYLDIMVHDINNANAVALGYAELLADTMNGAEREMVTKLHTGIRRSVEIIQNVTTLRRLRSQDCALQEFDLDEVIRAEIRQHPDLEIVYDGRQVGIAADELLPEVFTNLIGNSTKFGGSDVQVCVRVAEYDDTVVVSVEDTGPGVPEETKSCIFSRFSRGNSTKSGKGLGLYISRMLVERYGGRIWVDDRIPGKPEGGAAFRFTLQKTGRSLRQRADACPLIARC
ncbi:PAS domain S-box protein [Methanoculleus sp. FWC-SCC1]|uniref:histidine kinase n=1 Tax=Methanoculleus frigidifontis TaxID=2584085 RepID=A0ABT8MAN6_9EURY|nr:ATP-binding protein [Methanoculleus sp. FWC-SCC1]MDN7024965.1 PAS domain S-box protein [Methanoculleus sp. FWC-SCC1]